MVNLNLTLLVELGLFLVFLWLMHLWVLRPLVALMDRRDEQIEGDQAAARNDAEAAAQLEADYRSASAEAHREASHEVARVHRRAQEEHAKMLAELRQRAARDLDALHQGFNRELAAQRAHYPELAAEAARAIAARLGLEGSKP